MKFRLDNWSREDSRCFDELAELLSMERAEDGIPLRLEAADHPGGYVQGGKAVITYSSRHQIWRELGLLCEKLEMQDCFACREEPAYQDLGVMLDCSRNGVLTVEAVKDFTRYLALMGYSSVQLYTEDTYKIEGQPYFGYRRGAYSREEFREMDSYTSLFGIELIPCIQTLAHLECMLRWKEYDGIRDIDNILLADEEKTYDFIREMFRQMAGNLKSRRINIGMDEAHMLGLGAHLDRYGYENRMDIMLRHYRRVAEIAESFGYQPMMWSDMFFRLATHGEYYTEEELQIDPGVGAALSDDITLIYWDYYTLEEEKYHKMFSSHKKITDRIAFAGGAWKWEGPCPNSWYSRAVALPAHKSCRENGISQVMITAWGDNGDECPLYSVLPAFSQWAELCYTDCCDDSHMERRFRTCTGASYQAFLHLGDAAVMPDNPPPGRCGVNPVRYLLYQDLLGGLFDAHVDYEQKEYLENCARLMEEYKESAPDKWKYLFETQEAIDRLLAGKCMLGVEIRKAYLEGKKEKLPACKEQITVLLELLETVIKDVQIQWCRENKIYGLDILQQQLGGLKQRMLFACDRLDGYAKGRYDALEELEEEPLPYYGGETEGKAVVSPSWSRIVSAGNH